MSSRSRQGGGLSRIPRVPVSGRRTPAASPATSADTEAHAMPSQRSAIPVRARGQTATSQELFQAESSEWEVESIRPIGGSQSTPTFSQRVQGNGGANSLATIAERNQPRADSAVGTDGLESATEYEVSTIQQHLGPTLRISASADSLIMGSPGSEAALTYRRHGWAEPYRSGTVFYPRIIRSDSPDSDAEVHTATTATVVYPRLVQTSSPVQINSPESDNETHNPSTEDTSSAHGSGNEAQSPVKKSSRSVAQISDEATALSPLAAEHARAKDSSIEDESSTRLSPGNRVGFTRDLPRTESQARSIRTPTSEGLVKRTSSRRTSRELRAAPYPPRSGSGSVRRASGLSTSAGSTQQQPPRTSPRTALPVVGNIDPGPSSRGPGVSTHSVPETQVVAKPPQLPPRAITRKALPDVPSREPTVSVPTRIDAAMLAGNLNFDDIVTRHPEVKNTVIQTNVVRSGQTRSTRVMDNLRSVFSRNRGDRRDTTFEILNPRKPARAVEDAAHKTTPAPKTTLKRGARASPRRTPKPSLGPSARRPSFPRLGALTRTSEAGSPTERPERLRAVGEGVFIPPISHPHYRDAAARERMMMTESDMLDVARVTTYLQALETRAMHEADVGRREKLVKVRRLSSITFEFTLL